MEAELTIDEVLAKIGSFGRFQILLTVFVNLAYGFWWASPIYLMMFIASEPGWKCKHNVNSTCHYNETIRFGDDDFSFRCKIPREDWTYSGDFTSVVSEVRRTIFEWYKERHNDTWWVSVYHFIRVMGVNSSFSCRSVAKLVLVIEITMHR